MYTGVVLKQAERKPKYYFILKNKRFTITSRSYESLRQVIGAATRFEKEEKTTIRWIGKQRVANNKI